jgi:hypothetical protein
MKQRKQKNLASSDKTTVVMFVLQLFLLFDKTESCEPGELGEPSESGEPSDSTDSMFSRKVHLLVSQSLASEEFLISRLSKNQHQCNFQLNFQ